MPKSFLFLAIACRSLRYCWSFQLIDTCSAVITVVVVSLLLLFRVYSFVVDVKAEPKSKVRLIFYGFYRYVLQLAIADTVFLLTLPFNASQTIQEEWIYSEGLCKVKEAVLYINYYASIMFLMVCRSFIFWLLQLLFNNRITKMSFKTPSVSGFVITASIYKFWL